MIKMDKEKIKAELAQYGGDKETYFNHTDHWLNYTELEKRELRQILDELPDE